MFDDPSTSGDDQNDHTAAGLTEFYAFANVQTPTQSLADGLFGARYIAFEAATIWQTECDPGSRKS